MKSEEMMVDAGCIICCAELVDIVLMPCRHMVVCEVYEVVFCSTGRWLILVDVLCEDGTGGRAVEEGAG